MILDEALLKQHGWKSVTLTMFDGVLDAVLGTIKIVKGHADDRLDELERRVVELEARPAIEYRGIFAAGELYEPGDCCTRDGSLFVCKAAHRAPP